MLKWVSLFPNDSSLCHNDIKLASASSRPNIPREKLLWEVCNWPCKVGKKCRFFSKEHVNMALMNTA